MTIKDAFKKTADRVLHPSKPRLTPDFPPFSVEAFHAERTALEDKIYPPKHLGTLTLADRTLEATKRNRLKKPGDRAHEKKTHSAFQTIQHTDLDTFPVLDLMDTLETIDETLMTDVERITLRAIQFGASVLHEDLMHTQAVAARQIGFDERIIELGFVSLCETPHMRVQCSDGLSLHDLCFSSSSIPLHSYLTTLAWHRTFMLSIAANPSRTDPYNSPLLRNLVYQGQSEGISEFPFCVRSAGVGAALMLNTIFSAPAPLVFDSLPSLVQIIPNVRAAINAYNRFYQEFHVIRNRLDEALFHPKASEFPQIAQIIEKYIYDSSIADILVRELGLTNADHVRQIYRRIHTFTQREKVHASFYISLLDFINDVLDAGFVSAVTSVQDMAVFPTKHGEVPEPIWEQTMQEQRRVAEKLRKTTPHTFLLEENDLQPLKEIGLTRLPRKALVIPNSSNPYTQLRVELIDFPEPGNTFWFTLNTKKKTVVDWSCVADPQDPDVKQFHTSVVQTAIACLQ